MLDYAALGALVAKLDYDPLFVTVSGAHLYGFPSPDSDIDLRGCHRLPVRALIGLDVPQQTLERAFRESRLPEERDRKPVSDFLVAVRMGEGNRS
jgi:predicted nucleotidyltransferase